MRGRLAVFLAAWCVCGVVPMRAGQAETFEVRVRLHVDRGIASKVAPGEIEDEAERVWRPYGVQLEWAEAGDAESGLFSMEANVERRIEGPALPTWAAVLGHASLGRDAVRRPILVSYDATERMLSARKATGLSNLGSMGTGALTRALGRVLAHEIGHVLLAAPYHDATGLMRAVFSPEELGAPERAPFRLTCTGIGRLRSRIRVLTGASEDIECDGVETAACAPADSHHATR